MQTQSPAQQATSPPQLVIRSVSTTDIRPLRNSIPPRRTGGIVLLAVAALPGVLVLGLPNSSVILRLILSITFLLLVALGAVLMVTTRRTGAFSLRRLQLTPWWIVFYGLGFGILSMGWISTSQVGSAALISRSGVPNAVVAAGLGLAALSAGFLVGLPRLLRSPFSRWVRWSAPPGQWRLRMPGVTLMVYLIGFVARLLQITRGRYAYLSNTAAQLSNPSSLNQALSLLEQFARYGMILAALDAVALSRSLRSRITFLLILTAEIASSLASGFKSQLGFMLLGLAVVYAAAKGDISRKAVAGGVAALLLLIPLNLAYRSQITSSSRQGSLSPVAAISGLPRLLIDTYSGGTVSGTFGGSTDFASERLREIDNLALIMQRTPSDIPFRSPAELLYGPVSGLVPRAFWAGKPVVSTGYAFSQEYYNLPRASYTASAVTVPGDLYRHGGWLVLVAGMAVLGMILAAVEETCSPYADLRLCIFYGGLFLLLTNFESDVTSMLLGLFQSVLVLGILTRTAFRTVRR